MALLFQPSLPMTCACHISRHDFKSSITNLFLFIYYVFIYLLLFIFLLTDSFMPNFLNSLPSGEVFRYS